MYGPHSLLCLGDEMKICGLVPFFPPGNNVSCHEW